MATDPTVIASSLVARFDRMVRRDGGTVKLLAVEGALIRLGYRPGADPECEDGVCILPERELQVMIAEVLAAQAPELRVEVERVAQ
jgi:hypothetical protein